MPTNRFTFPNTFNAWIRQLGIATLYLLFGYVIHHNFTDKNIVNFIWPGSGLALAVVLIGGRSYIWGIFLGSLLLNILLHNSLWLASCLALAQILETLLGVWLLSANNSSTLFRLTISNYLRLITLGGGVACIAGTVIAVLSLTVAGILSPADYFNNLLFCWMRDTLGIILVTPFILAWWQAPFQQFKLKQLLESLLLIAMSFLVGKLVFLDWLHKYLSDTPRGYWMFLCVTWVAIRMGTRGATFVVLMIAIQALWGAYQEIGFFAHEIARAGLRNYWFYLLILSSVGMCLAVYVTEIKVALEKLQLKDNALNAAANGIVITDVNGCIEWANQAFSELTGFSLNEVQNHNPKELVKSEQQDSAYYQSMWETILANKVWHGELVNRRKDGSLYDEEMTITPLTNEQNTITHFIAVKQNITERKRDEHELRIAATVFESQEGMLVTDVNHVILRANQAFTRISGYTVEEVVGKTPDIFHSDRHDDAFYAAKWECIERTGSWEGEIWSRRKDGEIYPEHLTITAVKDQNGVVTNYVAIFSDITVSKAAADEIERLAFYDPLTQLPNRRLLHEHLKHGIDVSRRTGRQMAVLMLDLDKFKAVNDTLGHAAGDELLQQVAKRIKDLLRKVDLLARLGGDEFVISLHDLAHSEHVVRVAEAIIHALTQPFTLCQSHDAYIGASIGIAIHPQHGTTVEALMDNADTALYHAKDQGRGCFAYFSEELTQKARERIAQESRLRQAIAQQELRVYFQPQMDINNDQIVGAEALVRWHDPMDGMLMPKDFIALAEETGLIVAIGEWVLRETCKQGRLWLDQGLPALMLAVNVSPYQFRRCDMNALITTVLAETGFPAEYLELEITETGLMNNQEQALPILNNLRAQGVRLAIDDFGTGYSSLAYLKYFPLDVLKIDKTFINDIPASPGDIAITTTIIAMAHHLGFKVLAEGVETREQLLFLQEQGCDTYQGYLYSVALSADDFAKLLSDRKPTP